jgi:excisionase family DNA binding protein
MQFTLGTAAKRLGISKPTLSKHIRNGRLSARKLESGAFAIDGAELARFEASYQRPEPVEAATVLPVEAAGQGANGVEVALAVAQERARQLEGRLAEARVALERAEEVAAAARVEAAQALAKEREAWQRVAGLLEGPRPEPRGWWARLVGR